MANEFDQHDPKVFRETLGSFGTTTNPNARNQLEELQTKIRQGVKHVEIHLMNSGKGQFNIQDVPDKYGFEQRRTIMQLAKLNQQTLSVHGDFSINSFSGLSNRGFDETYRAKNIKEIDETLKFAAETAKGGAVVFHLHETGLPPTSPQELALPDWYLEKLKKEKPDEYKNIKDRYLSDFELDRQFVENPDQATELKVKYENLSSSEKEKLRKNFEINNWKDYYQYNRDEQIKLEQEGNPLVVVGNSITRASRQQDIINLDGLNKLSSNEKEYLKKHGIEVDKEKFTLEDFQRLQARFSNKYNYDDLSKDEYKNLRKKIIVEYIDVLDKNNRMMSKADKEYFNMQMDMQIELARLQEKDYETNRIINQEYVDEIEKIKRREVELAKEIKQADAAGDKERLREIREELYGGQLTEEEKQQYSRLAQKINTRGESSLDSEEIRILERLQDKVGGLHRKKQELQFHKVGQVEYQKIERYDEAMAQINEQIKKAQEQKNNSHVLTDEIFEKNASAMGQLGLKALRYQLDLKQKAKVGKDKAKEYEKKIEDTIRKINSTNDSNERARLNSELNKLKYDQRLWIGTSDYSDIDLVNRPLYLAPENIMAGYGYMDSLEEYKGVIRTSWDMFAQKILSDEPEYVKLRKEYEQETGIKITKQNAIDIAKKHIGGTFDNAHAGVWLKYFKRKEGESEEHRIKRFNEWLNSEAEKMAKEGIIKHVHFNDTQAKDDDHNLLGSGILDIHDLRERLRRAGIKEALIVEAGGRGANNIMHIKNAFDIFNPLLHTDANERIARGYAPGATSVSDWISVKRDYEHRVEYSQYGMSYNTFNRGSHPPQGSPKGGWSGTSFL